MSSEAGNPTDPPAPPLTLRPWFRNLAFAALLLVAAALVVGTLWEQDKSPGPEGFQAEAFTEDRFTATIDALDQTFAAEWKSAGLDPAPPASSLAVARRLSLALTGSIPSLEEIRAFESRPAGERVQWWLSHLFEDRRYADYISERFARAFVGVELGPFLVYRRHRLVSWLSDQFLENRPYHELARNLIGAEGVWTSEPEVNFITVTVVQNDPEKKGPDEAKLAGRITRAFLGARIDCMECHDDKFGDRWKQEDFHQLAAFFGPTSMSLSGVRENSKESYEYRYNGMREKEQVPAKVPFQPGLLPAEGSLRERLASWVTHPENRAFARATVNRLWALLFSRPLVDPVDDIPLEGPWPPAMEMLADEFIEHDCDVQHLLRVIAATRVFQLDNRSAEPAEPLTNAHAEHWAAFPITRLRPEQVAGSVIQASSLRTIDAESHVVKRIQRFFQQGDFIKRYGDPGEDEFVDQGGTIPQRLLMMNGKLVRERTAQNPVMNAATRIGMLAPDDDTAVESAYLAVVTRAPTAEEQELFRGKLAGTKGDARARAMEDLYWALMNSTEFSWNH